MKTVQFILMHAIYWALLILGVIYEVEGAGNLLMVWLGLLTVMAPFLITDKAIEKYAKHGELRTRYFYSAIPATLVLLWNDWIWCGLAQLFLVFTYYIMLHGAKKLIDKSVSSD